MASDMTLYWGSGSGPCWAIMIMLEEKGLQGYQSKQISFSEKGHKSEEIMKINPRGQVPTFKHGDVVVNESLAVVQYLQTLYASQGTCLMPADPAQMGEVNQRRFEADNLRKKAIEYYAYPLFFMKTLKDEEAIKKKKADAIEEIGRWEGYLKKYGEGSYIAGKDFSLADLHFFPFLAFLVRIGLPLAPRFPLLKAYYDRVAQRASVQASWPPHWKDTPSGNQLAQMLD